MLAADRAPAADPWTDVAERAVVVGRAVVTILAPGAPDELLDEEAFADAEFLPYWAELWPSAVALARYVAQLDVAGVEVLELGCGLGLVSIAAARAGARVRASDWSRDALAFTRVNARRNGVAVRTELLDWHAPPTALRSAALVLAADVLYEERNAAALLRLLPRVTAPHGRVLLADPGRRHADAFLAGAARSWHREALPDGAVPRGAIHRLWRR